MQVWCRLVLHVHGKNFVTRFQGFDAAVQGLFDCVPEFLYVQSLHCPKHERESLYRLILLPEQSLFLPSIYIHLAGLRTFSTVKYCCRPLLLLVTKAGYSKLQWTALQNFRLFSDYNHSTTFLIKDACTCQCFFYHFFLLTVPGICCCK